MTRKRKENQQTNLVTIRQKQKRKLINSDFLLEINPLTANQKKLFDSYKAGKNIVALGCAGTGKTFIALYNALVDVLNENTPYEKIYIVRSLVATRDIGFLPGNIEEKSEVYQLPYKQMVKYMFQMPSEADFEMLYSGLKAQNTIEFLSTSYNRGSTIDNTIIIVDEFQNANFRELDSIITRFGENTKIIFCGDIDQSDLVKTAEKNGIIDFMKIIRIMQSFDVIEFGTDDIVRSGLVKEYLLAKYSLNL
jgi:phosphate starvation-inducible protein PhoH